MEKVLDYIMKFLEPWLTEFSNFTGLNENIIKSIVYVIILFFIWLIFKFLKNQYKKYKNCKIAKDLKPEFDEKTIRDFSDIYIPTKYGKISPNRYDNPDEVYKHNEPKKLIPFMLKKSFNEKVENEKFYLVLGDSGMGKTAFMVNLYLKNWKKNKYQMRLFRFQSLDIKNPSDVLKRIKVIDDKDIPNTILLLDGLDEDPFIFLKKQDKSEDEAFNERINQIISATYKFKDIVITCRTQYFPQQEKDDYELEIRRPDNKGRYKFQKYYIYPFSNKDVKKFLNKKYGVLNLLNLKKKQKAKQVVKNSHRLMARPMLMIYIEDLVKDSEKKYTQACQIYEMLIEKWLIRESKKWKKEKGNEQEIFKENIYRFAHETALFIYQRWQNKGNLYISKEEAWEIAEKHKIELKPDEVKGKSLLTCDAHLNWKFAHKSILEYFLAKECAQNWEFAFNFNFGGMDMAKYFYMEMLPVFNAINLVKVKGGIFTMGSSDNDNEAYKDEKPQHKVIVSDFYICKTPVTQKQWQEIMGDNPSDFKNSDDCPVESVSWNRIQDCIKKLNEKTGLKFRLPTEAEWEYAARGGNKSKGYKFSGSNNLDEVGWYDKNSENKTHPVAEKNPNELGIYDMSGNVWEWCQDKWHDNYNDAPDDGSAWEIGDGSNRVCRGGSWNDSAQDCRVAFRSCDYPGRRFSFIGFRLVLVPQSVCSSF
jgi:formylglycine-generating enzyme